MADQRAQRPLSWEEVAAKGPMPGGGPPRAVPPTMLTTYVSGAAGTQLDPRVSIEELPGGGDRAFWRVDVDLGRELSPFLPGAVAAGIDIQELPAPGALDAHRPDELAGAWIPQVEKVDRQKLRAPDGREFTPLFIYPPDDRMILTDTSWPWLLVGKVTNSDGKAGSGALVGDRLLVTARHVAPWNSISSGNWWMKFTPHAWDGTEPFGSSFVTDIRYPTHTDLAHDYLVARLAEPLGQRLGYFGAQEYDDDWEDMNVWAAVGYAGDIAGGQRPTVQLGASIIDDSGMDDGDALFTKADLNHGDSGGPFWAWFDGHARIVGVVSGEADDATNYVIATVDDWVNAVSGGEHFVRLITWGRDNWPA
jgi:hypothetical protein